jgi:hypothetical protein
MRARPVVRAADGGVACGLRATPQLKFPKMEASRRAVPLQARALDALDRIKDGNGSQLLCPGERGGYLDIHHFRPFPVAPGAEGCRHRPGPACLRSPAHLRDLRPSMIDRHYGHLARDGREHAIKLLDALNAPESRRNGRTAPSPTTTAPK